MLFFCKLALATHRTISRALDLQFDSQDTANHRPLKVGHFGGANFQQRGGYTENSLLSSPPLPQCTNVSESWSLSSSGSGGLPQRSCFPSFTWAEFLSHDRYMLRKQLICRSRPITVCRKLYYSDRLGQESRENESSPEIFRRFSSRILPRNFAPKIFPKFFEDFSCFTFVGDVRPA